MQLFLLLCLYRCMLAALLTNPLLPLLLLLLCHSYAGATVFVEILAEMTDPRLFKRSFYYSMLLLVTLYLSFGMAM